jgi:hypothetical protein
VCAVARERHGILGPLTVSLSDCVDGRWWGFDPAGDADHGTLALNHHIKQRIRAALDYHAEWTGITKIRLPLERYADSDGTSMRRYRYEFVREAHNGQQHMVITPPGDVFCIEASYSTDEQPSIEKTQLAQALVERLHLRHAVVNGVDEFSVRLAPEQEEQLRRAAEKARERAREAALWTADKDELLAFLQTKGFSAHSAAYVSDTLGLDSMADLQHVFEDNIDDELGDLSDAERATLKDVCNAARRHHG